MRVSILLVGFFLAAPADAETCDWCGCKGGPGYRNAAGHCVGWAKLKSCGVPPTTRCAYEGNLIAPAAAGAAGLVPNAAGEAGTPSGGQDDATDDTAPTAPDAGAGGAGEPARADDAGGGTGVAGRAPRSGSRKR